MGSEMCIRDSIFIAISPRLHAVSSVELLEKAIPELGRVPLGCEAPAPVVAVGRVGPRFQFSQRVAELARASFVESVGDAVFESSVYGAPRPSVFEGGGCACGKLSLLLSRCARCAREEQAALAADAHPNEEDVVAPAVGSVSARRAALGPKWLPGPARLISSLDVLALSASGRVGSGESLESMESMGREIERMDQEMREI